MKKKLSSSYSPTMEGCKSFNWAIGIEQWCDHLVGKNDCFPERCPCKYYEEAEIDKKAAIKTFQVKKPITRNDLIYETQAGILDKRSKNGSRRSRKMGK